VVVVDEVHDADPYMLHLLRRVLTWLGASGTPVILLSATVAGDMAAALVAAYRAGAHPQATDLPVVGIEYPGLVRYRVDTDTVTALAAPAVLDRDLRFQIDRVDDAGAGLARAAARRGVDLLAGPGGGCVGVVMNTVAAAQEAYLEATRLVAQRAVDVEVVLLHARLTLGERQARTGRVMQALGKPGPGTGLRPGRLLLIATQVVEQSLDIDLDALVTAHAPAAQLLQRAGRVHRHTGRSRPAGLEHPVVRVLVPPSRYVARDWPFYCPGGSTALLDSTRDQLVQVCARGGLQVPGQVQPLIDAVYNARDRSWVALDEQRTAGWLAAEAAGAADRGLAESRAIPPPGSIDPALSMQSLTSPLNPDDVAATRLGGQGPLLLPLTPDGAGWWMTADGAPLPVAAEPRPAPGQVRAVLMQCVPGPRWADDARLVKLPDLPGDVSASAYGGDHRTADIRVLPLDGSGTGSIGARIAGYDQERGLWWTNRPRST
jgi:CRISPR-associated endonuclease/helicase Cas3